MSMNESDKRILITLCILLILAFVIIGYIGLIVERVMKRQAKKAGVMMHDVVTSKVINNERDFMKFARKKNNRVFAKQALIPMGLLFFALIIYIIYGAITRNWLLKIFDYKKEGFGTALFIFNWKDCLIDFFDIKIIGRWPSIISTPHWSSEAWASYLIVPCLFVGGIWLLVCSQAHMARSFRLKKIARDIFHPTIDKTDDPTNITNQNVNE